MIVLSYHRFFEQENEYRFSRTFEQFGHDLRKKQYEEIHLDDGRICALTACQMADDAGVRLKLFISPFLIGLSGYLKWNDLRQISINHSIQNHSFYHENHIGKSYNWQRDSIAKANEVISNEIGICPTLFVAPWNQYDSITDKVVEEFGLFSRKDRINILNISK